MYKYLSFDIECANCFDGIGKICEFGYAIADENLDIVTANDIPMSPGRGVKFYLTGRKNRKDVVLAYPLDHYRSQPEFPRFYNKIRSMLTNDEYIKIGFAVSNDINYVASSSRRYKLEEFDYDAIDVQKLVMHFYPKLQHYGLEITAESLGLKEKIIGLNEHSSQDDSKLTVYILEKLLKEKEITLEEAIKQCPSAKINAFQYIKTLSKKRELKEAKQRWIGFAKITSKSPIILKNSTRINVTIHIIEDSTILNNVIEIIQNSKNKLIPVHQISKSDVIIVKDEFDRKDTKERLAIIPRDSNNKINTDNIKLIIYSDFINQYSKI